MTDIEVKHSGYLRMKTIVDGSDGILSVGENLKQIPFEVKRIYYIYGLTDPTAVRGKHAHKQLEQALFCLNGSCCIELDDGTHQQEIFLDQPDLGIYLGVELWHTMKAFSNNCILLVLASDLYNESDYIRDYNAFKAYLQNKANQNKDDLRLYY